jgi:NAD(P)-dependent dehydrogenase (short-subunit alcohol dehydrogenase family)
MRIILVGASGTIGQAVAEALAARHDVVRATGAVRFAPLDRLTDEDFGFGIANKLMGQVNLVRLGLPRVRDGGSFTLTSGVLVREPIPGGTAISLVNGCVEGFVRAAAVEAARQRGLPAVGLRNAGGDGPGACRRLR